MFTGPPPSSVIFSKSHENRHLSTGKPLEEPAVAGDEIEGGEAIARFPARFAINQVLRIALVRGHAKENQLDGAFARVFVVVAQEFLAARIAEGQFLFELARQRLFGGFAGFYFAAGKLPLQRVRLRGLALADQDAAFTL